MNVVVQGRVSVHEPVRRVELEQIVSTLEATVEAAASAAVERALVRFREAEREPESDSSEVLSKIKRVRNTFKSK
jgi:hypothetical protein